MNAGMDPQEGVLYVSEYTNYLHFILYSRVCVNTQRYTCCSHRGDGSHARLDGCCILCMIVICSR